MAFESLIKDVEEVFDYLKSYVNSNLKYYKLMALKKVVNACSIVFKVLLCLVLILLALFFFSIAIAALIGRWMDSYFMGFVIVGAFYLVLFIIAVLFGVRIIRRPMLRMLAAKIFGKKR